MFSLPTYRINDDTLRDEPDDRDVAWEHLRNLKPCGERVIGLRMLGCLDEAEEIGWELLAAAGGPRCQADAKGDAILPLNTLGPTLRLAHVLHWQGRFREADVLFTAAISSARQIAAAAVDGSSVQETATTMSAFALQHLGKSRFDEDRLDEALHLFEQALAVRLRVTATDDQIASSRQAIAATRARLSDGCVRECSPGPDHRQFGDVRPDDLQGSSQPSV